MKLIPKNITLENVKKSNYWDLIAILVWNHYTEKHYQDESKITMEESWYGKGENCLSSSSYSSLWNNPNYTEKGFIRTLRTVRIIFERSDYITYININSINGNVSCYGIYTNKDCTKQPYYAGIQSNLDIVNWMIENNFIEIPFHESNI